MKALDFVNEVAESLKSFNLKDNEVIPGIKNWDNIGDAVFQDMNSWIRFYSSEHLPRNRKKEVEEFIHENEVWIKENAEAFAN